MTWRLRPVLVPLSASNLWTCSISAYKSVVGYTYVHSTTTEVEALVKPSIAFSLVSVTYNPPLQYVIYHEYLAMYLFLVRTFQWRNPWRKTWHRRTFTRSISSMPTLQCKTITFTWIPSDSARHLKSHPRHLLT